MCELVLDRRAAGGDDAVNDALARIGAPSVQMPATPEKVWRAIRRCGGADLGKDKAGSLSVR